MIGRCGRLLAFFSIWGLGLAGPASALDVPLLLRKAAEQPAVQEAAADVALRRAEAATEGFLSPWRLGLRQEGIGTTEGGDQTSYLSLDMPFDPLGRQAARAGALRVRADAQQAQVQQVRLEQQLDALDLAWTYLSTEAQLPVIDEALARLDGWRERLALRVTAGKLAPMELDRFEVLRAEVAVQRIGIAGQQDAVAAELMARGLIECLQGHLPAVAGIPAPPAGERPLPGSEALTTEARALDAQEEALRLAVWPAPSLSVEGERFNSFGAGQFGLGLGIGLELPQTARLAIEREQLAAQRTQLEARTRSFTQHWQATSARHRARRLAAAAERSQIQQALLPGIDRQIERHLSLIHQGRSDVFSLLDLERRRLDARLRAIELHATELQGGYALWLLAGGN